MKLTRREELLIKVLDPNQYLTMAEMLELGPVNNDDLTISGDAFIDRCDGYTKLDQLNEKRSAK